MAVPHWDVALCVSSSLGWVVAGVLVLLPSLYYVVLHLLAIAGFFAVATSTTARQVGAEFQRGVSQAMMHRVAGIVTHVERIAAASSASRSAPAPAGVG
jgi:hypothetical protein